MRPNLSQPRISADALEGVRLGGRYQVLEKISHGGMAWVYKGVDMSTRQAVAVKVLFAHLTHDLTAKERFRLEAQYQSQWHHPNIVRVIDYIEQDGLVGMVMDWIEGPSLQQLIERDPRPFSYAGIVGLFLPLVEAIGYAHAHQVVHRDLKPSNVLLLQIGQGYLPKVADFGIAKSVAPDGPMLTASNNVMGTVQYMAPEQILSSKHIDHRADIYSLGVIMYQLVTGRMLFVARGMHQWAYLQRKVKPAAPSEFAPDVPRSLEYVIKRCLEKDPADRYEDCGALRHALRATGLAALEDDTVYATEERTEPTMSAEAVLEVLEAYPHLPTSPGSSSSDQILQPMSVSSTAKTRAMAAVSRPEVADGPTLATDSLPIDELAALPPTGELSSVLAPPSTPPPGQGPYGPHHASDSASYNAMGAFGAQDASSPLGDESTWSLFLYIGLFLCILGGGAYLFFLAISEDPKPVGKGAAVSCQDGEQRSCYSGPDETRKRGICRVGVQVCRGGTFGPCKGEVLPAQQELCNEKDDDCDGTIDEGFQDRGKPCTISLGVCRLPGKLVCSADRRRLQCQQSALSSSDRTRRIQLTIAPKDVSFSLYIREGKARKARRLQIKGQACVNIKRASRMKIQARGYESCSFPVTWKHQQLQLTLQKKSELFNAPHYCLNKEP